jgi:hypothetical protein
LLGRCDPPDHFVCEHEANADPAVREIGSLTTTALDRYDHVVLVADALPAVSQ